MADPLPPKILHAPPASWRDAYYGLMRISWPKALLVILAGWAMVNTVFASVYLAIGGIANARPGSFVDAFDFSVQTLGTVGYGAMYPTTPLANLVVDLECVASLFLTALATGLVFARFSRSTARIAFTREIAIGPMDGVPTLMIRIGNERGNRIIDAQLRLVMVRTEITKEGTKFYRMIDLALVRERAPALTRSLWVMHRIDPSSPLYGETPESAKQKEIEISASVQGMDDTSLQPLHALYAWTDEQIRWGARHADMLSEDADGRLVLDVARFHDLEPTEATAEFPYPRSRAPEAGAKPETGRAPRSNADLA